MSKNHTKHRNRTRGFTMIPNEISYDKDLSLKGFGMLMKLLMLAEDPDWNFSKQGLVKVTGWKPTIVNTALEELERLGYLVMTQPRKGEGNRGQFAKPHWHIFESPVKVAQTGEVTELKLDLPNAFEYPNIGGAPDSDLPVSEKPIPGAPVPGAQAQYNTITIEEDNNIKNNNSECFAPRAEGTGQRLNNETGGVGEALAESTPDVSTNPPVLSEEERIIKMLKKKYKSAFVNYALELSQDKDDQLVYAKALLRDWKKQKLQTIQEVQRYVASFEDDKAPDLTVRSFTTGKPVRRVEQTPSWLGQAPQPYDPNRRLTSEEQQTVERMKQMQSDLLEQYAANLPF